ncbi:NAD-binding protein [Cystobasidium minutum MCA 4210]|uniref:NAD-binding protein n=1 Tax=Cystobasidium minutum MCA 4210 TaxID=1397322 RepID=UPI0034CE3E8C|eukprot:jgi/Rhomi1/194510/gm1.2724_g
MSKAFVCRWGLVGCGGITRKFACDLAFDPAGREVSDVQHAIVIAGSRDPAKAQAFLDDAVPKGGFAQQSGLYPHKAKAGTYEDVYNDSEVDVVYIGTPHPQHFEAAKAALEAGKGVLVEKPATLNAKESKILIDLAKEKGVFFMEGVWTRFFPLVYKFQDLIHKEKVIGNIHNVLVDFGMGVFYTADESHRLFNPELAGGAQLDIGPYTILWGLLALHEHPDNAREPPSNIVASSLPDPRTGVDLFTTIIMDFKKINARANLTANNTVSSSPEACVRVMGTKGELLIGAAVPARPTYIKIRKYKDAQPIKMASSYEETQLDFPIQGTGLNWEADAVARCIKDGKTTSERCSPETTLLTMGILDEWRRQSGYKYPAGLEKA